MSDYDLICLGGGSGGLATAIRAASTGAKVAVVEAGTLGGTCVNVGCVPKKVMWYAAKVCETLHASPAYGFEPQTVAINWPQLVVARERYIDSSRASYDRKLRELKVDKIDGWGEFVDPQTIKVGSQSLTAKHIVIATGLEPVVPDIPGADLGVVSDDVFVWETLPKSLAIVGAGYIAVELGAMLQTLGVAVTLVLRHDTPIRQFDSMLGQTLLDYLQRQGMQVLTGFVPTELKQADSLVLCAEDGRQCQGFDQVLWAVGRQPRVDNIGLANVGLELNPRGYIVTDEWQNTPVGNVYALGDIAGRAMLTPVAIKAGRCLADRLFGQQSDAQCDYQHVPTVIFTHPPIATIGLSEAAAREQYGDEAITIHQTQFTPMFYSVGQLPYPTVMKMITVGKEQRIIGCHMIGLDADEMIQGFAVAIAMGACKQDFDRTVAIHPTSAEEWVTMV